MNAGAYTQLYIYIESRIRIDRTEYFALSLDIERKRKNKMINITHRNGGKGGVIIPSGWCCVQFEFPKIITVSVGSWCNIRIHLGYSWWHFKRISVYKTMANRHKIDVLCDLRFWLIRFWIRSVHEMIRKGKQNNWNNQLLRVFIYENNGTKAKISVVCFDRRSIGFLFNSSFVYM